MNETNIEVRSLEPSLRDFAVEAARLCADRRCEDVHLIDVAGLSQVCDAMLIASGTSERQMKSVADELEDLGEEHGLAVFRKSKDDSATWVVIDFLDLVVHLFEPEHRAYYDLDSLWAKGEDIAWRRNGEAASENGTGSSARRPDSAD